MNKTAESRIHLKGLAIGNGLTEPVIQYGAYADFSYRNGLIGKGLHDSLNAVRGSRPETQEASLCSCSGSQGSAGLVICVVPLLEM